MSTMPSKEELENDPANWQEASAANGLKYFFNMKVKELFFNFVTFLDLEVNLDKAWLSQNWKRKE